MITIKLDASNELDVRIPRRDMEILALANAYIARETAQPLEAQLPLPPLSEVQSLTADLTAAMLAEHTAEANRSMAAYTYEEAVAEMERLLRRVRAFLCWQHTAELPLLEQWGFNVVAGKRGLRVKMPTRRDDWLWLLERYVAWEAALPPEQQLADPPLAEMQALLATLQQSRSSRDDGQHHRQLQNETGSTEAERLRNHLKLAAANLVAFTFDYRITADLRLWGFDVSASPGTATAVNGNGTVPETEEPGLTAEPEAAAG